MDLFSEEISHFIGLFAIAEEEGRERAAYNAFRDARNQDSPETGLPLYLAEVNDSFVLTPFQPNVNYIPPEFSLRPAWSGPVPEPTPPFVPLPEVWTNSGDMVLDVQAENLPTYSIPELKISGQWQIQYREAPPADQIATVIIQNATLFDVDLVEFRDGMFGEGTISINLESIAKAMAVADALQPFDADFDPPQDEAAIATMIDELAQLLETIGADGPASGPVITGEDAVGIFVEGQRVDAKPDLADRLAARNPEEAPVAETAPATFASGNHAAGTGVVEAVSSFEMESGGNILTNEVVLYDALLSGPNMLVKGDYTSLDIIMQTYVLSDRDTVEGDFDDGSVENEAVNVAERLLSSNDPFEGLDKGSLALPANFTLSIIEGNFLNLQWIEQDVRFVDDDWIGATHSGAATYLQTGDNIAGNSVRSIELGTSYDLIVVLGDVWKANVIQQTNILVDDDSITKSDAQTETNTTISHSDNLVWNEASIEHWGTPSLYSMSEAGSALIDALEAGPDSVTLDMLQDPDFAGLGTLNILLVKGDYLELDYIKQTIVATDSDHILIDETDGPLGENSFDTGGNTAINIASIVDAGMDQHVEVGGSVYSDALIHQAGFLDDLTNVDADLLIASDLATEAVLFLSDDMLPGTAPETGSAPDMTAFHSTDDVLQTMLA
ncbi:hypothetical protein [Fulvimarina sp. MAC3]|uniref:hypothetical protein n=1 Tax=Fulvimarina sp. MAC3 TaxID=3148887 RepID=UPI0031FC7CF5